MGSIPQLKRHRPTDWMLKQDPAFSCIQGKQLTEKDRHYLRIKAGKNVYKNMISRNKLEVPP